MHIQHTIQERHDNSKYKVNICGHDVPIKRLFIPLLGGSGVFVLPEARGYICTPIIVFVMSLIIYSNFPIIILFTNSRPLYYQDLFINFDEMPLLDIDLDTKEYYIFIFEMSIILTNSIFTAAMSEYWLYQTLHYNSFIEIIGITGGILKIFQVINHINGSVILFLVKYMIQQKATSKNTELV